jgi:hypothetical protein
MKEYILFFLSISSILDVVLRTVEPESVVSDDIFGYTLKRRKIAIITIEKRCPNSCSIASILGKANKIAKEPVKTKVQLANVCKSHTEIARKIILAIKNKIIMPKIIFCFVLLFLSLIPLHLNLSILSVTFIILGLVNLVVTGLQLIELHNL